jgi:deoxyxylulose-5-phosphate synthase
VLQRIGSAVPVLQVGVPDAFVEHGTREDNLEAAGLNPAAIRAVVERFWRGQGIARVRPAG